MVMDLTQLGLEEGDPLLRLPPVSLELRLARTAQADATSSLPGKVRPHPGQSGQPVLQLRQLDLQAALVRLRPAREDVEDQRRPVDDLHLQLALEVSLLGGRQLAIDHHQRVLQRLLKLLDFLDLALADVGGGVRRAQLLRRRSDHLDVNGLGQPGKLFQRILGGPRRAVCLDGNQQRSLGFSNL